MCLHYNSIVTRGQCVFGGRLGQATAPLCDISSFVGFLTGPWTVTRSSLRGVRRVVVARSAVGSARAFLRGGLGGWVGGWVGPAPPPPVVLSF